MSVALRQSANVGGIKMVLVALSNVMAGRVWNHIIMLRERNVGRIK